jgi:nucleotidyltransferase/DNA polymerase involved in DNA repair
MESLARKILGLGSESAECGFNLIRFNNISKSLLFPTNDLDILRNKAKRLIAPFLRSNKKVRLIGVKVSNLVS